MNEKINSEEMESKEKEKMMLAEYSYKALHRLIKSGMWKMYCNREFQVVSVEWSDDFRRMIGYTNKEDFPDFLESWSDLLHPEDYERAVNAIFPVLEDVTGSIIYDEEPEYKGPWLSLVPGNRRCFKKRGWDTSLFFRNVH